MHLRSRQIPTRPADPGLSTDPSLKSPREVPSTELAPGTTGTEDTAPLPRIDVPPSPSTVRSFHSHSSRRSLKLSIELAHSKRIAELEAERDRVALAKRLAELEAAERAVAREQQIAELTLQGELAAIDATKSARGTNPNAPTYHGRSQPRSTESRIETWLDSQTKNSNRFLSQVDNVRSTTGAEVHASHAARADPTAEHRAPPEELFNTKLPLELGTQKHNNCTKNKYLLEKNYTAHSSKSEIAMLAQAITDLASSRGPKVSDFALPTFSGRAMDWLPFRRGYDHTKARYTATENLARLNAAIKGQARDAVSSLLVAANDPEEVLSMLELRFARPELIVLQEVAEVRALPRLTDSGRDLNSFACRVRNCVATVQLLDQVEYLSSPELCQSILSKFTPLLRSRYADFAFSYSFSNLKLQILADFLTREADLHVKFGLLQESVMITNRENFRRDNIKVHNVNNDETCQFACARELCLFCNQKGHSIDFCDDYRKLSAEDRYRWAFDKKVCRRCLVKGGHTYRTCPVTCKSCGLSHHSLLHRPPSEATTHIDAIIPTIVTPSSLPRSPQPMCTQPLTSQAESLGDQKAHVEIVGHSRALTSQRPLLKIIPVSVSGPSGAVNTYALLDDGSTATLIDSSIANAIGSRGPESLLTINCVNGLSTTTMVNFIEFKIRGRHCTQTHTIKNARAIPNLNISNQSLRSEDIDSFSFLTDLRDVLVYNEVQPTILIGADNWHLTLPQSVRKGYPSEPVAVNTALGWVLYGFTSSKTRSVHSISINYMLSNSSMDTPENESLESLIKENYKLDSIGIVKKHYQSPDEEIAIGILDRTSRRLPSGRFETGLLWKPRSGNIPNSYSLAVSRLLSLERRFRMDEQYAQAYRDNINSTIHKGYAELCSEPPTGNIWYLPHFGVIHPHKRKLRVVHDAAATVEGVCLNSLLLAGPDLLQPLLGILMRFREGLIALSADIREMFPQVKIRQEDRDAQRFLWRDSPTEPIREYRMSSMIFGATSSPCTAIYIKNKNAEQHRDHFPHAVDSVIRDHYMDDFLGSVHTVEEASKLAADIVTVHNAAGFEMRAWISNNKDALSLIAPELHAPVSPSYDLGPVKNNVRVLGVSWNLDSDSLIFLKDVIHHNLPPVLTKRIVLSQLMKVFDPLGFLTPIVICGRIYFQQTWRLGIGWDQKLPDSFAKKWLEWYEELKKFSSLSTPRCYITRHDYLECQLHVFADASEHAYACVAYWRFSYPDGTVKLSLIGGKARLAPLKPSSIPRLELQAALIACRFSSYILDAHRLKPSKIFFWSDSLTVLKWLRSDARCFKTFVALRVGEILESTDVCTWRYVPTSDNVADDATRPNVTLNSSLRWFSGPSFLRYPIEDWPLEPSSSLSPPLEELKVTHPEVVALVTNRDPHLLLSPVVADHNRFSVWCRLIRATARIRKCEETFRLILYNIRTLNSKLRRTSTSQMPMKARLNLLPKLSASDLVSAEKQILVASQIDSFKSEFSCVANSRPLPKASGLAGLDLTVSDDGVLRLSSRIKAAKNVPPPQELSPMVLDGNHRSVQLLIRHYHVKFHHGYNEAVINELLQRFHVLRLRPAVKKVAQSCLSCRKRKNTPLSPPMGDLPEARLDHGTRPFANIGIDYFGPISVTIGRRTEKRWVVLITCLVVRAVHLEMIYSLSTDSAIMALKRFVARRGCPARIYSDNGTAFVGAAKKLDEVFDFAANQKIDWHFIPPAAPFMGGCWERLVRSVKRLLTTLKARAPKEEVLLTLLLEAEAVVNSRPLTFVSVDPDGQAALTPFCFLLGSTSNDQPPPKPLDDHVLIGRQDWKKGLRLADHFWARWVKEYLPLLRKRPSLPQPTKNIECGELVVVVDGSLPRAAWPMGRVVKVWPGKDGAIRVAEVETKGGTLKRATKLLIPIPTSGQMP